MQTKTLERYFFFSILLLTIVFSFLIFRPFITILAVGACFAIVLHPILKWLKSKKVPNGLAAFLVVLLFIILVCGPLLGIGILMFKQSQGLYFSISEGGSARQIIEILNTQINNILPEGANLDITDRISDFASVISANLAKIFSATLATIFGFVLTILTLFYFLKDGSTWKKALTELSPLSEKNNQKIIQKLFKTINGVIKGYLLIALTQGFVMGLGLTLFNVPNPILWGFVAAMASLIPTIGTSLVSIPVIIYLFINGNNTHAIGFALWAAAMVGSIDDFLSPYIIGSSINIPTLLILFSILGGIVLLGPVGILIGPITISFLYTLVSIYREEFQEQRNEK
jgi:predicted PurR-regulated permease PerM